MKTDCDIINDLLPLYAENKASAKSRRLVEEHLSQCESCRLQLSGIKEEIAIEKKKIERGKKEQKIQRRYDVFAVIALILFMIIVGVIIYTGAFKPEISKKELFSFICFYLVLPVAGFLCSVAIGLAKTVLKWSAPFVFGCFSGIVPFIIFNTSNVLYLLITLVTSFVGIFTGKAMAAAGVRKRAHIEAHINEEVQARIKEEQQKNNKPGMITEAQQQNKPETEPLQTAPGKEADKR